MKKWARILFLTMISVLLLSPASLLAVDQDASTSNQNISPSSSGESDVQEDPTAADYKAKLMERLAKNKEAAKANITKAQQARIKSRCKLAQGKVGTVNNKIKTFKTSRAEIYDKIENRLVTLSEKLKSASVDTTELDKQIAELQALIAKFKADVAESHQAAADLANMDCSTDPSAFKASLEILRAERTSLATDSATIRAYINDTIKPTLQAIKQSVAKSPEEEGN